MHVAEAARAKADLQSWVEWLQAAVAEAEKEQDLAPETLAQLRQLLGDAIAHHDRAALKYGRFASGDDQADMNAMCDIVRIGGYKCAETFNISSEYFIQNMVKHRLHVWPRPSPSCGWSPSTLAWPGSSAPGCGPT